MKKTIILLSFIALVSIKLSAQAPPPPPPTGNNGGSNGFVGGSGDAPVGNGTFFLLTLAVAYAGRKVYAARFNASGE